VHEGNAEWADAQSAGHSWDLGA